MNYLTTDTDLTAVADAIRAKVGVQGALMYPDDYIDFIGELVKPTGTKSITENGTNIDVAQYSKVNVNVSGGGGTTMYSGSFTPAERVKSMQFYAPGCTWLMIMANAAPSMSTGNAFIVSICGKVGAITTCQSNNGGTAMAVSSGRVASYGSPATPYYIYKDDTFTVNFANSTGSTQKVPQVGLEYVWFAW